MLQPRAISPLLSVTTWISARHHSLFAGGAGRTGLDYRNKMRLAEGSVVRLFTQTVSWEMNTPYVDDGGKALGRQHNLGGPKAKKRLGKQAT